MAGMTLELGTPGLAELGFVLRALREWQDGDLGIQLHPGDLGWCWRHGADATAASVRVWRGCGQLLAIGFLDGPGLLRVTVAPHLRGHEELAAGIVADCSEVGRGILPGGRASVEAPRGTRLREALRDAGWGDGDTLSGMSLDLSAPVDAPGLSVRAVRPGDGPEFTAVHGSAWGHDRFDDDRWAAMAAGPAFSEARCLLGRNSDGVAVACATVWSAGRGRPGLIEPLGVHAQHRRRGHGRAICLAAAAELRRMGASHAHVVADRPEAVATYLAAGFTELPRNPDATRAA